MNTDFVNNKKVKLMVAEFGSTLTWGCLLFLYSKIYGQNGYWLDWMNEDDKLIMAEESKIKVSTLNEFVAGCIRRSLFDKGLFDTFGILTSDRIQENYIEAKKRVTRFELIRQFLKCEHDVYINLKNVNIIDLNVNIIAKNVYISTQKEKEKEKEIQKENKVEENEPPILENKFHLIPEMCKKFSEANKNYAFDESKDYPAIKEFAEFIANKQNRSREIVDIDLTKKHNIVNEFGKVANWYKNSNCTESLETLARFKIQKIFNEMIVNTSSQSSGIRISTNIPIN